MPEPSPATETPPAARPQGAEAVREALIRAAAELFARRGPAAVTVREIARQAQVNHGLVHRHFGSKDALLGAVLGRLAEELAAGAARPGRRRDRGEGNLPPLSAQVFRATRRQGTYWRVLAHALLEGADPGSIQPAFPVTRGFVKTLERWREAGRIDPALDPRALAASVLALGLGFLMFEPFLLAATGLGQEKPRQRYRALALAWRRLGRVLETETETESEARR